MSKADKIKLAVAGVVLLSAVVLIYFNVRTPTPTNPVTTTSASSSSDQPSQPSTPSRPRGPARGRYQGK